MSRDGRGLCPVCIARYAEPPRDGPAAAASVCPGAPSPTRRRRARCSEHCRHAWRKKRKYATTSKRCGADEPATAGGLSLSAAVATAQGGDGGKKSKKGLAAVGLPVLQKAMEALGHDQAAFRQTLLGLR